MDDENKKLIEPMEFFDQKKETKLETPMEFDVRDKSPEEKLYIILYKVLNGDYEEDMRNIYSLCVGRTETYNDIKTKLQSGLEIDVHRSRIITETKQTETETGDRKYYLIPYQECISVYAFCNLTKAYFSGDDFEIEDYNTTDIPEEVDEELQEHPMYLTADQQHYRTLLESIITNNDRIRDLRAEFPDEAHNV